MLSQLTFCCQVNTFLRGGGFHGSININAVKSRTDSASININAARFRIWGPRQATIHWVLTPTSDAFPLGIHGRRKGRRTFHPRIHGRREGKERK